jgi:GNAT superfamily N-acetyltransferase
VQLDEFGELSLREWIGLTGRDGTAFGAASAGLEFRPKDRHVGYRNEEGRLEAVVGATVVRVHVESHGGFDVVGIGGLIIRKELRGKKLATPLMDAIKQVAERMGPDLAMIFCDRGLVPLYESRGYAAVAAGVWVDQPSGRISMPVPAMWRRLRPAASTWPEGRVDIRGLPF